MKKYKKLISYTLLGLSLAFLTSIYQNFATKYDETFKDDTINVEITFGSPHWENDYCTFPNMTVSEKTPNTIKTIQISYSGTDTTNANITAPAKDGFDSSPDNINTMATYTTTKTAYEIQEFLRSIKYQCNSSQSISILLSGSNIPSDTHYFPGTGHFYKYVSNNGISWSDAYKEALNSDIGGWRGYLAVITSKEEDDFYKKYAATNGAVPIGWLGGTCYTVSNMGTTSISVGSTKVGYWYWACGPESVFTPTDSNWSTSTGVNKNNIPIGTYGSAEPTNAPFYNKETYSGTSSSIHVRYSYAPWHTGEPNNSSGAEGCLVIADATGIWNDFSNTSTSAKGYTIEYGDRLWGNSTTLENSMIVNTEIGKPVTIKYRYNNTEGTGNFTDDTVYYNTTLSQALDRLPEPTTIPKDYTFEGWYTAASGGTKVGLESNVADLLGGTYSSELNLYAQWHINEDITKPEIKSITLTHEESGQEMEYVSGNWSRSDVKAKYIVSDPYVSGAQTSGIDTSGYYISLDGGANYYSATSNPPTGVTDVIALEDELSFKVSLDSPEEGYKLKIKVTDKNGNSAESEPKSLMIDKTKPLPPADVNSPATSYTNVNTPTISGKGEPKCTVTIKEGDAVLQTVLVNSDGSWKTTLAALTDGVHSLSITQSDSAGNTSDETSITLKIDTVGPLGEINIKENKFTTFLNKITFGMFFKDTIDVTFKASDENGSGVKTIEYLKADSEFQTKEEAINAQGWTEIPQGTAFSINSNNSYDKFIIYSRITDNAGNITCINSNGVIVYTDSAQDTSEMVFTKTHINNLNAVVKLNGNTINKIINSTQNVILTENTHYAVSGNTITFYHTYLDSLAAGEYTFTIHYNPAGQPFSPEGVNNDEPETTSIKLTVQKATQSAITITGINSPYTYGDNSFPINIDGGNGSGSVSYSSSDESVATISSNTVTILKVGTFTITATKSEDENYNESSFESTPIIVNPKSVSITGLSAKDKVYDTTSDASILGTPNISGKLDKDDLTVNLGQALFENPNAEPSKTVHFSGFSLSGTDSSNYTLSSQPTDVLAEIFTRPVTINGIGANDKVYDGNADATIAINGKAEIVDNLDGENLVLNTGKATFGDKSAGKNKLVSFTGFTLSGPASSNYTLFSQPTPTSATITAKNLLVTNLSVSDKPYDGLNVASISSTPSLDGLISGDNVILINGTPTFSSVDVSQNINIIFSDFYLSGPDSNNYSLTQPSGITANITQGFLPQIDTHYTLNSPDGANSWYVSNNFIITAKNGYILSTENKNESSWTNELTYSDQTADFEAVFYVRNIDTKEISQVTSQHYKKDNGIPTGIIQIKQNEFKNFLNTITFGMFFKEKIEVKISESDNLSGTEKIEYFKSDTVYSNGSEIPNYSWIDGGTIINNSISFNADPALWGPDQVNEKFFVYAKITDYAGNICYLRSDGIVIYTDSTQSTSEVRFTKTSLSSQFASVNLNGNTVKTIFNGNQELSNGSDYQVNGSQIEFKPSYLDSLPAGQYSLTVHYNPAGITYMQSDSNSAPLTTSIDLSILRASQNSFDIVGLNSSYTYGDDPFEISIDSGSGSGAVSFASSDTSVAAVNGNIVTIINKGFFTITATKDSDENYDEQSVQSHIVTVNPKPVTLDQIEVYDKVYDGNSSASISKNPTITGNIDGENLSVSIGKAFFDSKDAGSSKTVTFVDFAIKGISVENYTLISQPNPIKANITKRPVNISGLNSSNKIYDSHTDAQITGTPIITNKIESDNVEVKYGKAHFSNKNCGHSKEVSFSEFDIIGDQSANYFLESQPVSVLADIDQKGIDIINININSKIYDKTSDASFKSNPDLSGVIAGDEISLINGIPSFTSNIVSENIPIEFTPFSIQGGDSENYYLKDQPSGITANITPKELIIKDLKIKDKIFDGYDTAEFETTPTLDGVIPPDEVTLLVGTPSFSFKDVSHNVPIIFTPEFSIAGKDSSNYSLAPHPQISANINMSQAFNQRDPSTNLWVEAPAGVFPEGAKLVVQKFSDDSPGYERIFYDLDEDKKQMAERLKLFEIHIIDKNGDIIQPNSDNGLVTVRIPVPDDFDVGDLEVYRVLFDLPDDEFNEYVVNINSNHYCEFKTNHFSPYALIDKKSENNTLKIIIFSSSSIIFILIIISLIFLFLQKKHKTSFK